MRLAVLGIIAPFAANIAGWIFTEIGRQPFVVAPNPDSTGIDGVFMYTAAAVSPGVTAGELLFSVITLTLVYAVIIVVELFLLMQYVRGGSESAMPELTRRATTTPDDADAATTFSRSRTDLDTGANGYSPSLWFVVIAVLWLGFLALEGFDLGVGMHILFGTRDERERRVMLNTIGPVWDGNEVWLITAGAAIFAAFPLWYASLFSALYVPLTCRSCSALILRAVSIEYRGKVHTRPLGRCVDMVPRPVARSSRPSASGRCSRSRRRACRSTPTATASAVRSRGPASPALLGGLAVVGFALAHGRDVPRTQDRRRDPRALMPRRSDMGTPVLLLPAAVWAIWVQIEHGGIRPLLGARRARGRRRGLRLAQQAGRDARGARSRGTVAFIVVRAADPSSRGCSRTSCRRMVLSRRSISRSPMR